MNGDRTNPRSITALSQKRASLSKASCPWRRGLMTTTLEQDGGVEWDFLGRHDLLPSR
jgi:hypothetical protein